MDASINKNWINVFCFFWVSFFAVNNTQAQRYLVYYPTNNLKKKIQINIGQMLEFKTKNDAAFQRGYISNIDDTYIYFNDLALKISAIDKIKVYTGKSRAIIPRVFGFGAQLYVAVRLINSAIRGDSPIITPLELAITLPIIAAYYIYEFGFNTKYKVFKVNENKPLKAIIFN